MRHNISFRQTINKRHLDFVRVKGLGIVVLFGNDFPF